MEFCSTYHSSFKDKIVQVNYYYHKVINTAVYAYEEKYADLGEGK